MSKDIVLLINRSEITAGTRGASLGPDAIFTATDSISTTCLVLLKQMNYSIPNDIALIGFSNTDLADVLYPPLSTISQPAFEIGKLAAEKLLSLINNKEPEPFKTVLLATELQERKSTLKG